VIPKSDQTRLWCVPPPTPSETIIIMLSAVRLARQARLATNLRRYSSGDPWPLPHTPQHKANTTTPADASGPTPLPRPNEATSTMRARLVYQSRKRGTLESDLLLSTFARDHLAGMPREELLEYDRLLDEADWDIYYWATGEREVPERWKNSPMLARIVEHAKNEGKVIRSMPALDSLKEVQVEK